MACPPEDCGGLGGYARCVELAMSTDRDEEDEFLIWLGDWKPDDFDSGKVRFENPKKRFLECMED